MNLWLFEEQSGITRQSIIGSRADSKTKAIKSLVAVMEVKVRNILSTTGKRVWSNRVKALKGYQKRGRLDKNYFIRKVEDENIH